MHHFTKEETDKAWSTSLSNNNKSPRRLADFLDMYPGNLSDESWKDAMSDWVDFDGASHLLARRLGIFPHEKGFLDMKWMYWTSNPVGNDLADSVDMLVVLGILERRDEPDMQYRIKK